MGRPWRVGHAWEACARERRGLGLESGSGTTRRKGMISGSRLSVAAGEGRNAMLGCRGDKAKQAATRARPKKRRGADILG
jgi:hypothetical protein